MSVPYELADIEKLVAEAKRRRATEVEVDGPTEWYNDKVGALTQGWLKGYEFGLGMMP